MQVYFGTGSEDWDATTGYTCANDIHAQLRAFSKWDAPQDMDDVALWHLFGQ